MYVESCKGFQKCVQVFKTIAKASRDFQSLVESCTEIVRRLYGNKLLAGIVVITDRPVFV